MRGALTHESAREQLTPAPAVDAGSASAPIGTSGSGLSVSSVLALQRSAGNRFVGSMLRAGGPTLARNGPVTSPATDTEFRTALREQRWSDASRSLNQFAEPDIGHLIHTISDAELQQLADAADGNGADDHTHGPIAAEQLDRRYRAALRAHNWAEAATQLNGFNIDDIRTRLTQLAHDDPDGLIAIDAAAVAGHFDNVHTTAAPIVAGNEPRRIEVFNEHYRQALAARQWPQVASLLNGASVDDRAAKLAVIHGTDDLVAIRDAAQAASLSAVVSAVAAVLGTEPHVTVLRTQQLERDWTAALAASDWAQACVTLRGFSATDIQRHLDALTLDQVSNVARLANGPRRPEFLAIADAAERTRIAKHEAEYTAAVAASNWPRAADLANGYNDDDLLAKIRALSAAGTLPAMDTAARALYPSDAHRVRRTITFLQVGPAPRPAAPLPAGLRTAGASEYHANVPGGSVDVTTNDQFGAQGEWYGMSYQGTDAPTTGWIQFIWRDVEKFDAAGTSLGRDGGSVPISGQPAMQLSSNPASPAWIIDSLSASSPFYESAAAHETTAASTTMFDRPGPLRGHVNAIFADPAVRQVKSRAHFDTYLVRDMHVLHHVSMNVEWTFNGVAATDPVRVQHPGPGGAVDHLPDNLYQAMLVRFPAFTYIPHGP